MNFEMIFNRNMKRKLIGTTLIALTAVACNTKIEIPEVYGELSVSLAGEPTVEVVSKAGEQQEPTVLQPTDPDAAGYMVRIYTSDHEKKYESPYSEFKPQKLPLGAYYVTAENCTEAYAESAESGKGKKRIAGQSTDVTLTADALTGNATVNCTVTNALVSVKFDASVEDRFSGLKVTLAGGTSSKTVTVEETAIDVVTETWFNPSDLTYTITGTFTGSGMNKPVEISKTITLAAKNNILLLVKVNLENGQLMPSVTVNTQIDGPTEVTGEFNPYKPYI